MDSYLGESFDEDWRTDMGRMKDIAIEKMQLNCWVAVSKDDEVTLL